VAVNRIMIVLCIVSRAVHHVVHRAVDRVVNRDMNRDVNSRCAGLQTSRANRAEVSLRTNSLTCKNIRSGANLHATVHLCSAQINFKSSALSEFMRYEQSLKFPEQRFHTRSRFIRRPGSHSKSKARTSAKEAVDEELCVRKDFRLASPYNFN